ncbi:amino acid adenylation domain-containing protein [Streptomyces sp. NPDC060000]|uniref:non-ribosomal peptide synthetase n=1 Tax=Streptomyces sp. NPDC060000 TaxID=3347031 RepID=UPI0036950C14
MAGRKEEALWLLERLAPESAPNNLPLAFQVEGRLSVSALREAFTAVLRRHEVLRTVYFAAGADLTKTVVGCEEFSAGVEEVDDFAPAPQAPADALTPFVARRFTFDGRPLVRAALFHHPGGDVVCFVFHHLVYDTLSAPVFLEEFTAAYGSAVAGQAPDAALPAAAGVLHEAEPGRESIEFWRQQMAGFDPQTLRLRCGTPQVSEPALAGAQVAHTLSPQAGAIVKALQKELRAPEAVILLAAYFLLLAAHGAGPDITVGSPVNVRPPGFERAIGYHVNVLPLRVTVDQGASFRALVRTVRDTFFDALVHAQVPVDSISGLVPRTDSSWRSTLFRHLFNYVPDFGMPDFDLAGLRARPLVARNGFSKFDLEFFVMSSRGSLRLIAVHDTAVLGREDATALLHRYEALLLSLAGSGPGAEVPAAQLRVWSEHDHEVIGAANATARPLEPASVLQAVHDHAVSAPRRVAVQHGPRAVTYRQLWEAAETTCEVLTRAGVSAGDVVAVAAARSPELVAAVLGIWLAGGAYLPLDPEHPAQRLSYLLSDSGARVALSDSASALPAGAGLSVLALTAVDGPEPEAAVGALRRRPAPDDAAYLIYTSGSTGRSKGALITHAGLANTAAHFTGQLQAGADDATLWMTTFAFDMAGVELHVPLYSGGRIVIAPDQARTRGDVLRALLDRYEPNIVEATPTTWRLVLDQVADRLAGRRVIVGGEPVPASLVRSLLAGGCQVHHAYGPTETTIWSTSRIVADDPGERLDVGRPIANTQVLVLDPTGRELPVGVRGEVCIAGRGVALGYHGRPELSAERFTAHPVHGRCYRTGDLGHWRSDGTLELAGRADRQVKLRGNRIELGEVEQAVLGHPRVRAAAALVSGDLSADARLVVFVESTDGGAGDLSGELWEHARSHLAHAAIPQDFVVVDALPTNANQKIDYIALARLAGHRTPPGTNTGGNGGGGGAPENADADVRELLALWRRLLERDDVDATTNFFTHGGHSLLGAQLLQHIEKSLDVTVKLADLFASPTPAGLAAHIRTLRTTAP